MGVHGGQVPGAPSHPPYLATSLSCPASHVLTPRVQVGAAVGGLRLHRLHGLGGGGEGSDALAAEAG
ncbi:hypothetical protein Pmani_030729 [Petrolisthes manimaculis]|uniref:Uncharacterized protein n=1 Tax=Petrolisthes manimaculis TaxID=1843537 RepID=A0AAE1TVL9_9EUCA|nr:hypothetical protein Pmani_030729 [Petrolisthes manimaculis]